METKAKLLSLSEKLREIKDHEALYKAARIAIEGEIAELIPTPTERSQKTVVLENGMKITVKRALSYKADLKGIREAWKQFKQFPQSSSSYPSFDLPIKTKQELDVTGYEWYRKEHPELFRKLSEHVVTAPRKISVSLTLLGDVGDYT